MKIGFEKHRGYILLLIGFGLFRTAVADSNPIPSGSMRPNLLEGDVVLVNRLAYDFKLPLTDIVVAPELARETSETGTLRAVRLTETLGAEDEAAFTELQALLG